MFWLSHDIVLTILISAVLSMCDEFFSPADRAILKESVPSKKDLNNLISKLSMIDQVVNIAGTALSGVLLSLLIAGQSMLVCSCLSLISVFFLSNWLALSVLIALFGFLTSFQNILSESMIQITTEDAYLGRVLTTIRTSTSIGGPISSVVAGIMLDHSGDQILIILCAIFVLIGGINMLFAKEAAN